MSPYLFALLSCILACEIAADFVQLSKQDLKATAEVLMAILRCRLEEHGDLAGPEGLLQFDERLYKAARGLLQEGAWAELLKAGGSAPALLSLPSSFPPLSVSSPA